MTDPFPNGVTPDCGGCKDPDKKACPASDCYEHYICNQKLLKEVAARLPADWEKLGIYLDVSKQQRDAIGGEKRNKVEAWGLDMFNKWWQNASDKSRWSDLQNALTEVHRHDLIQFTKDFFRDNNVNPTNPDQRKMDKYFQKMAEQIPRDWKDIGIYLYLSLDDLHNIQMAGTSVSTNARTYEILDAWRKSPNGGKWLQLREALEEIGRRDVIMHIEQEVQRYKGICPFAPNQRERVQRQREEEQRRQQEHDRQFQQEREQQRLLQEQQAEIARLRQELQQQQSVVYHPSNPPTANYIPPNERNQYPQQPRYSPPASHDFGPEPPRTAFNQGAGVHSFQPNLSVSNTSHIAHPTPDQSFAQPEQQPRQQLDSMAVLSISSGGSQPSYAGAESPPVAQAREDLSNLHLNSTNGRDSDISANTMGNDLTAGTVDTDDGFSLVGFEANPSQPRGAPSTSVSVDATDVELRFVPGNTG